MLNTEIRQVVVAGAGTMGVTLARLFAQSGYTVTLWNRRQVSLDKAEERIRGDLFLMADQGLFSEGAETIAERIRYTTELSAFETADFVVESIAEDLDIKQEFFRKICSLVPENIVLATNTSGLPVTDIARAVTRPERFCGMHWWNPPDLIPLVEVTKGELTGQDAAQIVYDLAVSLEKKPVIVKKDILGIIGNRLQYAVLREALHIIELGAADPEDVDAAMKYGPGFRYSILGPLETVDLGGLDVFRSVSDYLFADLSAESKSPVLNDLADQGRHGVKTGAGFYDYGSGEGQEKIRWRNDLFRRQWDLLKDNPFKK